MRRIGLAVVFALSLFVALLAAEAQQAGMVHRIGLLTLRSGSGPREEAFRHGLRDLGYVPGRDMVIEERYAAGGLDRSPANSVRAFLLLQTTTRTRVNCVPYCLGATQTE